MLTPSDLGISPAVHDALLWVREELASGRLRHVADDSILPGFNMNIWGSPTDCQTPHCIGGWANHRLFTLGSKDDINTYCQWAADLKEAPPLHILFYPFHNEDCDGLDMSYDDITAKQALAALDNYLTTGHANWRKALTDNLED